MTELNDFESVESEEGISFEECLNKSTELSQRSEVLKSPFEKNTTIEVEEMPTVVAIADPHMVSSQSSLEGIDGMASFKRRILGNIKVVRNRTRLLDTIARFTFRRAMEESENHLVDDSIFIILGDTVLGSEASNAFSGFSTLESSINGLDKGLKEKGGKNLSVFNLVGNHYSFTGVESSDYKGMHKAYERVDNETFRELASALEKGYSWSDVITAWMKYRSGLEVPQRALHPLQKWYLEKLTFGSQVGRYIQKEKGSEKIDSQVVFLDNLLEDGGTSKDLYAALKELEIDSDDPLYYEIRSYHEKEEKGQRETIRVMLDDCRAGIKTVVFTHLPELMQKRVIHYAKEQFNWNEDIAKSFVEENMQIWGGHRHLGDLDLIKPIKGVVWVKAITREFISFLAQKPVEINKGRIIPFTLKQPFSQKDIDYPEIVIGKLDNPRKIPIQNIQEDFNRRMEAIRDSK